jgi:PKD repeat protein
MGRARPATALFVAAGLALAGCTIKKTDKPPLAGPSELALALSLYANPDVLTQDGASQSQVVIQARDPNGQPVKNLPLRADIVVDGVYVDYGRLSAKNLVTESDGRATTFYTPPIASLIAVDPGRVVTILVTPIGSDYRGAEPRRVDIRLVPPGVITPPNGTPTPAFSFSPTSPLTYTPVYFDASASTDDGQIVSYTWNFGDGSSGSGQQATHEYREAGDYLVTLTIVDDMGISATSEATSVRVTASQAPVATFAYSPAEPVVGQDIYFNAAQSQAAQGRYIVSYAWNFGSGSPQSGMTVVKSYDTVGTYVVTLVVTDNAGGTDSTAVSVRIR